MVQRQQIPRRPLNDLSRAEGRTRFKKEEKKDAQVDVSSQSEEACRYSVGLSVRRSELDEITVYA